MKKTKLEKGITLIALIITIIILLILAVVTIGSIRDSKIIDHAQDASNEYTIGQEKEQIGLALSEWQIEKYTGEKSFKDVVTSALNGIATVDENVDGSLTVTMKKTGNPYIVTDSGEILPAAKGISISPTSIIINEGEKKKITVTLLGGLSGDITYSSSDENVATVNSNGEVIGERLGSTTITVTCGEYSATCQVGVSNIKEYLFGTTLSGRLVTDILNTNSGEFLNEKDPKLLGEATITTLNVMQIGDWGYVYFQYQGIYYKVRANMTTSELEGVQPGCSDANYGLKIIDTQGERVGKTVNFDGKLWTILYDDNINGLQMVSNESFCYKNYEFDLGYYNSFIKISEWDNVKDKVNLDTNETLTNFEKSMYSYNNAIEMLNTACDELVSENSNILEVRCVGSNPTNKNAENATPYLSTKLENWPTSDSEHSAGIAKEVAKGGDTNYEFDFDRMTVLGIKQGYYWLASRFVYEEADSIQFHVLRVDGQYLETDTIIGSDGDYLCAITESSVDGQSTSEKLRPVVSLKTDIQFAGSGTEVDPYTF